MLTEYQKQQAKVLTMMQPADAEVRLLQIMEAQKEACAREMCKICGEGRGNCKVFGIDDELKICKAYRAIMEAEPTG